MAIACETTLESVASEGTKSIPQPLLENVVSFFGTIWKRDFEGKGRGGKDVAQTAAAERIGLSQPTLNALKTGTGKGVGLNTLLILRKYEGRSIDDMLGLPPLGGAVKSAAIEMLEAELARVRARNRELEMQLMAAREAATSPAVRHRRKAK